MAKIDSKQLDQMAKLFAQAAKLGAEKAKERGAVRDKAVHQIETFGKTYQGVIKDLKAQMTTDQNGLTTARKTAREKGARLDGPLLKHLESALALLKEAQRDINPHEELEGAVKSANAWPPESSKHGELKAAIQHLATFKKLLTSKNGQTALKEYEKQLDAVFKDLAAEKDPKLKAMLKSNLSKIGKLSNRLDW
jgi:hypothetical protein